MTDDEVLDELIDADEWALWKTGEHRSILRKLAEERRARSEADGRVVRELCTENERLREAVRLGMHYLKGRYPIPVKEAEVLAKMQAAIGDNKDKP